jgi:thiosulfate/3-mercaptopyruvate sulfurtransferase
MSRLLISAAIVMAYLTPTPRDQAPPRNQASRTAGVLISAEQLAAVLKEPALVLLHVGERPSTFEEAHIPGARFLRYGDFAIDGSQGLGSELPSVGEVQKVFRAVGVSNSSRVVIYGTSTVAAARAFFTLDAMGHSRVEVLDGGLRAWRAENQPIETGPATAARPGDFNPVLNASRLASAQQIQQQMPAKAIALVDVRPDPEFLGTDGGMGGMHAAGHIEGAKQLPWDTLVAADGRFLPRDQLAARLASAGAVQGKPVVSYCMVGMRASVVYLVARHLGYDAKLYDGSMIDWSTKKLPVVTGRQ